MSHLSIINDLMNAATNKDGLEEILTRSFTRDARIPGIEHVLPALSSASFEFEEDMVIMERATRIGEEVKRTFKPFPARGPMSIEEARTATERYRAIHEELQSYFRSGDGATLSVQSLTSIEDIAVEMEKRGVARAEFARIVQAHPFEEILRETVEHNYAQVQSDYAKLLGGTGEAFYSDALPPGGKPRTFSGTEFHRRDGSDPSADI